LVDPMRLLRPPASTAAASVIWPLTRRGDARRVELQQELLAALSLVGLADVSCHLAETA
jgi:hypothetical protein